jgi:hypothetical protein
MDAHQWRTLAAASAAGAQIAANKRNGLFVRTSALDAENFEIAEARGEFCARHDARGSGLFPLGHGKRTIIAGRAIGHRLANV